MTEHSLPQFAAHNHHSAAEDVHMLWQQIRHSKVQQTFSASSNRAALSAPTPAVWRYCSQAAPSLCFMYTVHTHTEMNMSAHAHMNVVAQKMCAFTTHTHTHTLTNTNTPTHWSGLQQW